MKLGFALLFAGSIGANAQYNADYKMGKYSDPQTIESTVDIGDREVVTVGTLEITEDRRRHKDIVLTRLNKEGKVIWNFRYGLRDFNEEGNGITLSWDRKHVIVVGSSDKIDIDVDAVPNRQAMVLKIRISDGVVVWSKLHGIEDADEQGFLVKRNSTFEESYIIVGTSSGDPEQSFTRMYAFKIKDNGSQMWSNRYYLSDNFPILAIRPTSMVENGFSRFMIAGIRQEINRPSKLFTIGINTSTGAITDDLFYYNNETIYHVDNCDIDKDPEGNGYALSFTARDFRGPCLAADVEPTPADTDRIGVIRLNNDRKVLWSNVYWEHRATNQSGLSVDFYKDQLRVCVNINRNERYNTSGILSLKEGNGGVIFCNTYHVPASLTDYGPVASDMIFANNNNEYYVKSVYADFGFSMVNPDISTKANCDKETRITRCLFKSEPKDEKCDPKEYGKDEFWKTPQNKVDFGERFCELDFEGMAPEGNGTTTPEATKAIVYPSPVGEDQTVVNVKFKTELHGVNGSVRVFNSQGQELVNNVVAFTQGENRMQFDTRDFAPGIYLVMITDDAGAILDRVKFIKE